MTRFLILALTLLTLAESSATQVTIRKIFLIDRTGSMETVRPSTGNKRCDDALAAARADIVSYFAPALPGVDRKAAVWTFADVTVADRTSGFVGATEALAAVDSLFGESCTGCTPLADAICKASTELGSISAFSKALCVYSDGGENNSSSAYCDPLIPGLIANCASPVTGAWEAAVLAQLAADMVVNVYAFDAFSTLASASSIDLETGLPVSGTSYQGQLPFLEALAITTGGTFNLLYDDFLDLQWSDLGLGLAGVGGLTPSLSGESDPFGQGVAAELLLEDAAPSSLTFLFAGLSSLNAPFKGGLAVADPDVIVGAATGPQGSFVLSFDWPAGLPTGLEVFYQYWTIDAAGPKGFSASNGLKSTWF